LENKFLHLSKYISLLHRHQPELAGLTLDNGCWAVVGRLLSALQSLGEQIDLTLLDRLVAESWRPACDPGCFDYQFWENGVSIIADHY
jgi:putative RNA 2'-phosphotransferase